MEAGLIAPWFEQPGNGMQYHLAMPVWQAVRDGFLVELCKPATHACGNRPGTDVHTWLTCDTNGRWVVSLLHTCPCHYLTWTKTVSAFLRLLESVPLISTASSTRQTTSPSARPRSRRRTSFNSFFKNQIGNEEWQDVVDSVGHTKDRF